MMMTSNPLNSETEKSVKLAEQKIFDTLRLSRGTPINIVYATYTIIMETDAIHRARLLRIVAEKFDESLRNSSEEVSVPDVISNPKALEDKYGDIVDSMFKTLVEANHDEQQFYERLWSIIDNPFFPDPEARVFALYYVLIDKRIPYFKLEVDTSTRMSDDEFGQRLRKLRPTTNKIRFIISCTFKQKTEQADLVLREIMTLEDVDRIVATAYLISQLRPPKQLDILRQLERRR
jgi:hypothetical protein